MSQLPIRFPMKGLVENVAFSEQGPDVTQDVLNVRPHDVFDRRRRGGRRTGISKYIDTDLGAKVQHISGVVEAVDLFVSAGFGDKQSVADSWNFSVGDPFIQWGPDSDRVFFADAKGDGAADETYLVLCSYNGSAYTLEDTLKESDGYTNSSRFQACWTSDGSHILVTDQENWIRAYPYTPGSGLGSPVQYDDPAGDRDFEGVAVDSNDVVVAYDKNNHELVSIQWNGTSWGSEISTVSDPNSSNAALNLEIVEQIGVVSFYGGVGFDSVLVAFNYDTSTGQVGSSIGVSDDLGSITNAPVPSWSSDGASVVVGTGASLAQFLTFSTSTGFGAPQNITGADVPVSVRSAHISGGNIFLGSGASGEELTVFPYAGAAALGSKIDSASSVSDDVRAISVSPDGTAVAVAVGSATGFSAPHEAWQFTQDEANPSARRSRIVAVAGGSVYRSNADLSSLSVVASGTDVLNASVSVRSDRAFQSLFFVDGFSANYGYLDLSDATYKDWASDLTAGGLPEGTTDTTLGCTLIAVYRGRVVLSGLKEEPQNWFMSKAGDPFDFDYSPATTSATQAVAGNNSEAGEMGDVITSLIPFQDDLLVMGGAQSIWIMRGDPAAGGQIDNITRQVGVAQAESWALDVTGNLYFMGVNGLYRMPAGGGVPDHISRGRLDKTFESIDYSRMDVRLFYDHRWQGVHVFITPALAEPSLPTSHYFWDERTDSFWRDEYPTNVGPTAAVLFQADDPDKRGILFGGWDGYIRAFDDSALSDDGTAIESRVQLPIIGGGQSVDSLIRIQDLRLIMADGGGDVTLKAYSGETAEEASDSSLVRFSRTLPAGRSTSIRHRMSGNYLKMVLEHSTLDETWAMEGGSAALSPAGKVRRRSRGV